MVKCDSYVLLNQIHWSSRQFLSNDCMTMDSVHLNSKPTEHYMHKPEDEVCLL